MKIVSSIFLIATFALNDVNGLKCYDCGSSQFSDCLRRTSECLMANSTCADVRIRDEVRDVDYIVKGCTPVDICVAAAVQNRSRVTISCSQCSEDLCNDKPSTPARKTRTVRAASGWWSKLRGSFKDSRADSTPPPPVETTSSKQKRGIGPWLDAGSEILRYINNNMEREAAAVAQANAQAQAHAQAMALSSGSRLYLSSFILILSIFKFIF